MTQFDKISVLVAPGKTTYVNFTLMPETEKPSALDHRKKEQFIELYGGYIAISVIIPLAVIVILFIWLKQKKRKKYISEVENLVLKRTTYDTTLYPPPAEGERRRCTTCGESLDYIAEHNAWYCYMCDKYE
jgi:hypothetical protein